jgi:Ribbon-helix-helix protein, copG family
MGRDTRPHGAGGRACFPPTYGVYRMHKTTVYLPDELKRALAREAVRRQSSEAALIREAVRALTGGQVRPRPRVPLFRSGRPGLAERVDSAFKGFSA